MPMRWRWPPENSWRVAVDVLGRRPTRRSVSRTNVLALPPAAHAVDEQALAHDVAHGHARVREPTGSWKNHLHLRPQRLSATVWAAR